MAGTSSSEEYDVIVIGGGVNGLVSAAYLAKAGAKTLIIEEKDIIGGGCTTQEINAPGYRHDVCATVHDQIQDCPLITQDELGLFSHFGLRYLHPEPMLVSLFRDNKRVIQYQDVKKSAEDISKFSKNDALAYERLHDYWLKNIEKPYVASRAAPPVPPSQDYSPLEKTPQGQELMTQMMMSCLEMIEENFEDDHVKSHILRLTTAGGFPPEEHGLGLVLYGAIYHRHTFHWGFVEGGSQGLPDSLVRCIQHYGGRVLLSTRVGKVLIEDGVVKGVELENGKRINAKKAVISSIHVKTLMLLMVDEKWLPEDIRHAIQRLKVGVSEYVIHLALNGAPKPRKEYGADNAVLYGTPESTEIVVREFAEMRRNRVSKPSEMPLQILDHAAIDSKRAPPGCHVFNVSNYAPYDLDGDVRNWEKVKMDLYDGYVANLQDYFPNLERKMIVGYSVFTPIDIEKHNSSFLLGNPFGLDYSPWQMGYMRPLPSLSDYRTSIKGLYITGACTWPGAAVQGHPGRNAAHVIMQDLGISTK